jgi:uncharacterized repeat protein (TIGR01451 family)
VFVIDVLPGETTFVSADGDGKYGQYDPSTHTYTWSYPSLGPRDSNCVEIVVQLDERVGAGTTVTNNVMAAADETPEASDSADVIIGDEFLRLSKMVVSGAVEDPNTKGKLYASAGDDITYAVCVGNPSKDRTLTRLSIVDTLPEQVRFVTADGDGQFGYYDPNTHTYTWFYGSLEPGMETCLRLVVRVKEAVEPNVVITNTVTVEGKQTAPVTTVVDVVTRIRSLQAEMFIKPTRFFRATSSQPTSLIVTLFLPEGYGKEHIADTPLVLSPGSIRATSQQIFGTSSQGKIFAFFDRAEFLAATKGYGQFKVTATGRLLSGGSFGGDATVTILGSDKL